MLEVAIHNALQHQQFLVDAGGLRLVRAAIEPSLWVRTDPFSGPRKGQWVEVTPAGKQCCTLLASDVQFEQFALPTNIMLAEDTRLEIAASAATGAELSDLQPLLDAIGGKPDRTPASATLARWLEALGTLHRWIASTQEFFVEAARFVVDPIGLDGAMLLRRRDDGWEITASHLPHPELGILFDRSALDELLRAPTTRLRAALAQEGCSLPASFADHAVVVSPLVDARDAVIGAVYGFRAVHERNARRSIRPLEARLVEMLAASVSAGIARLEREAHCARRRTLLEHAFSPAVANQLELDPDSLRGQQREVTLLFADLRSFTSLCTLLGTEVSYELLNEIMDELTAAVLEHDGVVIDYYGDGLSAMWNAPVGQPQHPELAARAALAMLERLPAINERWTDRLPWPLRVGIGLHTGPALVGNIGSRQRLKYGPRGNSVNLASRVEAATKRLRVPLLATAATVGRLSSRLLSYRVCRARLDGFDEPVDLYAISRPTTEARMRADIDDYQRALELYESGELDAADELLSRDVVRNEQVPTRFLAEMVRSTKFRQLGRRRSDQPDAAGPIIELDWT